MNPRTLSWLLVGAFAMVLVALVWLPNDAEQSIRDQTEQAAPDAPTPLPPGGLDQRTLDRSKPDESPPSPSGEPAPPHAQHPSHVPNAAAPEGRP